MIRVRNTLPLTHTHTRAHKSRMYMFLYIYIRNEPTELKKKTIIIETQAFGEKNFVQSRIFVCDSLSVSLVILV